MLFKKETEHTFSLFINHVTCGGGLAGAVVQLASNISPTSYVSLLKVITGSASWGSAKI